MMNVLRIFKINILSILALPLLLISVCAKLLAKAMEKLLVIACACVVLVLIVLGYEFLKNPLGGLDVIVTILAFLLLFGLIISLIIFAVSIFTAVFYMIVNVVTMVFDGIYTAAYGGYVFLYDICIREYDKLGSKDGSKLHKPITCLLFTLVRGLNRFVIFFAACTMYLAVGGCLAVIILSLLGINRRIQDMMGISVFQYLSLFSTVEIIFSCILYLAVMGFIVTILLSLGVEWSEWGEEMKLAVSGSLPEGDMDPLMEEMLEDSNEEYQQYIAILNQHLKSAEEFTEGLMDVLSGTDNLMLRSSYGSYMKILGNIIETVSAHGGKLSEAEIKKLLPDIKKIDKLRSEILKMAERKRLEIKNSPSQNFVYFSGCSNSEKLDKRYKSLCKTYHPDGEAGDEETFKVIQAEYEKASKMVTGC